MPLLNHEKGTEKRMKWLDNTFFSNTNITVNRCGSLTCWNLAFDASTNFSCFLVDLQIILFIFETFLKKKSKFLWKYVSSSFLDTFPKRNNILFLFIFLQLENSTISYIPYFNVLLPNMQYLQHFQISEYFVQFYLVTQ